MVWEWPKHWDGEKGGWWKLALTFFFWFCGLILGIFLLTALMLGLKDVWKDKPAYIKDVIHYLVGGPAQHGLMLLGCFLGVRLLHRKPVSSLFTDGRPFKFGLGIQSFGLWIILWLIGVLSQPSGLQRLTQRAGEVPLAWWPILTLASLFAIVIQSTDEEVVFRGYLLTRLAAWVKYPWLAICLMSVIFTGIHFKTSMAATLSIAVFSVFTGMACIRMGTLAPLIGMHAANNMMQGLWYPKGTNMGSTWLDAGIFVIQMAIWFGWLLLVSNKEPGVVLPAKSREPII